jgi:hypothetical protein
MTAEATIGQSVARYEESDAISLPNPNAEKQEKQGGPITDNVGQRHSTFVLHTLAALVILAH